MAEGEGFADENVAIAVVVVVVEVAAAEAGAVNCYLDLVCRGSGYFARFLLIPSQWVSISNVGRHKVEAGALAMDGRTWRGAEESSLPSTAFFHAMLACSCLAESCGRSVNGKYSQCGGPLRRARRWLVLVLTT